MKPLHYLSLLLSTLTALLLGACTKDVLPDADSDSAAVAATRAYGDKSPKVIAIIETNDVDPRNALSYRLGDSVSGPCFFDIVEFFAANIHRDANGDPTIYFNPELAPLLADTATYVKPIKDAGVKAVLSILGDAQKIGVANLSDAQADRFTDILTWIVKRYGFDGISFDDEYAYYEYMVDGSFGRVIKKLRAKLDAEFPGEHKLIGVDQWGNYSQIDAEAGAMIDYVYHGAMGASIFVSSSLIPGVTNDRFSPQTLQLGMAYNTLSLKQITMRSKQAKAGGYGAITTFNLRLPGEVNSLPVFQAIAEGAFESTVYHNGTVYEQDWTFIPGGKTITYDDVTVENPDPVIPELDLDFPAIPATGHGSRTPIVQTSVYLATTNPLNAGSYSLGTSTSDPAFIDLCVLDAVKIHKNAQGDPTLYLDADMLSVLSAAATYIRPLQNKGIGVLLRIVGDYQKIGVANMTDEQADRFTDLLVWVVGHYGLNGVSFDDEYADYNSMISGSYANVILKLREKFDRIFPDDRRLIALKEWGNTSQITAEAGAAIDYANHGTYGANTFYTSYTSGMTADRWAPMSLRISQKYNILNLNQIRIRSMQTVNGSYGMISTDDLRAAADVDPLPVFLKIAEGAFTSTVTCDGKAFAKDWTATATRTIDYDDILKK